MGWGDGSPLVGPEKQARVGPSILPGCPDWHATLYRWSSNPIPSLVCSSCPHLTLMGLGSPHSPLDGLGLGWLTNDAQVPENRERSRVCGGAGGSDKEGRREEGERAEEEEGGRVAGRVIP